MYVAVTGSGKARVIQFREDTHIPGTRKKKTRVVKTIGNYERMLAEDPDIIEKLRAEARALTAQKKAPQKPLTVELGSQEISSPDDVTASFHFGHALVKQIWQRMALDTLVPKAIRRQANRSLSIGGSHREMLFGDPLFGNYKCDLKVMIGVASLRSYSG